MNINAHRYQGRFFEWLVIISCLLCVQSGSIILAQNPDLFPCGTPVTKDPWRQQYLLHQLKFRTPAGELLQIPLKIHLVGSDEGHGFYSYLKLMSALCQLNNDYLDAGIQFFIFEDIDYIYNSAWNNHETVLEGADMMFRNNDPRAINCYIASSAAGNCGYNLPYAGVILAKSCVSGHTWAHELGHNLSLQHPFLGWEGKTYSYDNPTPKAVTYDYTLFKDSLITDTTIIDTAYVELVDGSNCTSAADRICDTPPDYLSSRWQCDENSKSTVLQKDFNGEEFYSDGTLFMSYSSDECQTRFTPGEIDLMRATILHKKTFLLDVRPPVEKEVADVNQLGFPSHEEEVPFDKVSLHWEPVAGAVKYVVQVSLNKSFTRIKYQGITDTSVITFGLKTPRAYYWRVFAFGRTDYCSSASPRGQFVAIDPVSTNSPGNDVVHFHLHRGSDGRMTLRIAPFHAYRLTIDQYTVTGDRTSHPICIRPKSTEQTVKLSSIPGLNIVVAKNSQQQLIFKKIYFNQ